MAERFRPECDFTQVQADQRPDSCRRCGSQYIHYYIEKQRRCPKCRKAYERDRYRRYKELARIANPKKDKPQATCKLCGNIKQITWDRKRKRAICAPCERKKKSSRMKEWYNRMEPSVRKRRNEAKRLNYAADPDRHRAYARKYHKKARARRLFHVRACEFSKSYSHRLTAKELWSLWKRQRGLCGLTGRRLDGRNPSAVHLDHIVPKVSGGQPVLENLRWVCADANRAKRNLSDEEFARMCLDIVAYKALRDNRRHVGHASPC